MVTNMQEYYDLLYRIQDQNKPSLAVLIPSTETIYDVDYNQCEYAKVLFKELHNIKY